MPSDAWPVGTWGQYGERDPHSGQVAPRPAVITGRYSDGQVSICYCVGSTWKMHYRVPVVVTLTDGAWNPLPARAVL